MNDTRTNITHNLAASRFECETPAGLAVLDYERSGGLSTAAGRVDFTRTFVPAAARGQGIAEALVYTGLRWARAEGLEISASCWYVEKFLKAGNFSK